MSTLTYLGDGPDVVAPTYVDLHSIMRRDGHTLWRTITLAGQPGYVQTVSDTGHVTVVLDDHRYVAHIYRDGHDFASDPTFDTKEEAQTAMDEMFGPNPDEPFGHPDYLIWPVTRCVRQDEVVPTGWVRCTAAIRHDERLAARYASATR